MKEHDVPILNATYKARTKCFFPTGGNSRLWPQHQIYLQNKSKMWVVIQRLGNNLNDSKFREMCFGDLKKETKKILWQITSHCGHNKSKILYQ